MTDNNNLDNNASPRTIANSSNNQGRRSLDTVTRTEVIARFQEWLLSNREVENPNTRRRKTTDTDNARNNILAESHRSSDSKQKEKPYTKTMR